MIENCRRRQRPWTCWVPGVCIAAIALISVPAPVGASPPVGGHAQLPPFHGWAHFVSSRGLYGACVSARNPTQPVFNFTTGSGGVNTTSDSRDCLKSPGYGDAYSGGTLLASVELPVRAGVRNVSANYSYSLSLNLSATQGRCVPTSSSGAYCYASSEYNYTLAAFLINVSAGQWWNGGSASYYAGGYEQLTDDAYCGTGGCHLYNFSTGCTDGIGCGLSYPSQPGWVHYFGKGVLPLTLQTPMAHGYRYVLQFSLWITTFALSGATNATYQGYRSAASVNLETLGNGLQLVSIKES